MLATISIRDRDRAARDDRDRIGELARVWLGRISNPLALVTQCYDAGLASIHASSCCFVRTL
jgi:hypothetical protein